jgi:hypothetical protein
VYFYRVKQYTFDCISTGLSIDGEGRERRACTCRESDHEPGMEGARLDEGMADELGGAEAREDASVSAEPGQRETRKTLSCWRRSSLAGGRAALVAERRLKQSYQTRGGGGRSRGSGGDELRPSTSAGA